MKPFVPYQPSSTIPVQSNESSTQSKSTKSTHQKRLCRNVIIHGFCKFQDKGCEFKHDSMTQTTTTDSVSVGAPIFVPRSSSTQGALRSSLQPQRSNTFPQFDNAYYPPSLNMPTPLSSSIKPLMEEPYYYMNNPPSSSAILQYHVCPPTLPHISNLHQHQRLIQSFHISDNLKDQLIKRNESTMTTVSAKELGLPEQVHVYHSLCPLEDKPGRLLGHASWVYKAISRIDGKYYTMIRIEGFRLVNEQAMKVIKQWRQIRHANIVSIHEAFTTRAFGDSSLVFIYDYHPCSITLSEAYFSPQAQAILQARFQAAGINGIPVPETTLWSFITQMASVLKTVHQAGLSVRTIEPNKIIMTSKNRLRICCTGLMDVLQYDSMDAQKISLCQQEDLLLFGKLILSLACHSLPTTSLIQPMEYISRFYSADLKHVVLYLLAKPSSEKSMDDVFSMIGPRLLHELNSSQHHELENSRLVRLMSKLNFINERPEYDRDPTWSEEGDRYMIKLFRDYVFHQVDDLGLPMVDMAHVISCLNKLDVGVDEKILLTSRDDQTSIVVTYKELKTCISSAFHDLYHTKSKK
ncbi:PAB-dependent poly(A)-specific ribonuclease subunit pan3 [Choanephora cucurbitarum]|uniref:PAN2-PAN3 deadenylation complex subunit PAN3 n=1 Tax=Choanephora cucurbitarum TaxID=101091 RepID=A0A1C7N0Z4_9FUNG|nr:PAB-dependent poly(A)-specific ribonuclease subunit pan3 [Choanephora cucurbitarum]